MLLAKNTIKKHIKNNVLFLDGAFGTYYVSLYDKQNCEHANVNSPDEVIAIHHAYAKAGANLLRSNTFAANICNPTMDDKTSEKIIRSGFKIAKEVANQYKLCFPCADIGPVTRDKNYDEDFNESNVLKEYKRIIDIFIDEGAQVFVFETMSEFSSLIKAIKYLREKKQDSYIICQFAIRPDGYTKSAISVERIVTQMDKTSCDVIGFNCASGPMHMMIHLKKALKLTNKPISALPNAGFPTLLEGREVYSAPYDYFGQLLSEMIDIGVKFPGGCCGSTPKYIESIIKLYKNTHKSKKKDLVNTITSKIFDKKINLPDTEIYVELTPPHNGNLNSLLKKTKELKEIGIKNITLPDSPLGRARMNPIIISSKVRDISNQNTLIHLCCRDRNILALQSDIMAGWSLGLRDLLCVTGDPVSAGSRDDIKSVFNLSAIKLMELVNEMNKELFADDPIRIYGAVNLESANFDKMCQRTQMKYDAGAKTFLSQPIFSLDGIKRVEQFKNRVNGKLMVGIMPPVTYKNALFLKNEVPGINIPDEVVKAFKGVEDRNEAEEIGCKIVGEIAAEALKFADGLYISPPFGRISCVGRVLNYVNQSRKAKNG